MRARYCAACLPDVKRAISEKTLDLARLAKTLKGPVREETRARLRQAAVAASRERRRWEQTHPDRPDPAEFRTRIFPLLATVPVRQLARLMGLSVSHVAAIKRGELTPHPRHWETIIRSIARYADFQQKGSATARPAPSGPEG
jgi:transcriptional regulator with XRE-family HTH domain